MLQGQQKINCTDWGKHNVTLPKSLKMWTMMMMGYIWLQHAIQRRIREKVMKIWAELYRLTVWSTGWPLWSVTHLL